MSQIATTIEQSRDLLNAGLDPWSADMYCRLLKSVDTNDPGICQDDYVIYILYGDDAQRVFDFTIFIPAWSLSALWQMAHELDKTYDFPSELSADELMETLVKTIIYRKTH